MSLIYVLLCVTLCPFKFCNHLDGEEMVVLICFSSCPLVSVLWLFLTVQWIYLLFVIVVFPDHTHLFLALNCIYILKVLQWVLIMLLLLQICFCFVLRETLCCLILSINQAGVIEALNSTARYLGDLLNMDNYYFNRNQFLTVR